MYWYTQRASMPLLYLVSQVLLPAPAASTDNERSHSVAGRIMSKTRCSMSSDSLDRNLMGYYWLRKLAAAKAEALKQAGRLEDLEDLDDLGRPWTWWVRRRRRLRWWRWPTTKKKRAAAAAAAAAAAVAAMAAAVAGGGK